MDSVDSEFSLGMIKVSVNLFRSRLHFFIAASGDRFP